MRYLEHLNGYNIPVSTITIPPSNGRKIFTSTAENLQGPIGKKMEYMAHKGQELFTAGHHSVFIMPSLAPHNPIQEDHTNVVYWIAERDEKKKNEIKPWNLETSLQRLAHDKEFLREFENRATSRAATGANIFFVTGWTPPVDSPALCVSKRGGLQSVASFHVHDTPPFSQVKPDRSLAIDSKQPPNEKDLQIITLFLDFAAEVARSELRRQLGDFSNHQHEWRIADDKVARYAYGFLHLDEAIEQLVSLDASVQKLWPNMINQVAREHSWNYMFTFENAVKPLLLLPRVLTASVFVPTDNDKRIMGLSSDDTRRVWVSPFSLIPKSALVDGLWTSRVVGEKI